jgi:GxxExxY protein
MHENQITKEIVDAAYKIHVALGPGLLESAYEAILEHELTRRGLSVKRQVVVPLVFDGITIDEGFRADLIVNDKVIVELKSIEKMAPVHKKQLLTYQRATGLHVGLLINFGAALIRDGIERIINGVIE